MYDNWLYFFHSSINTILIDKKEYSITKEYMENGNMKISSKEPSEWYVILQQRVYDNVLNMKHNIENQKKNIEYEINKIVDTSNFKEISNIEKEFKMMQESVKKINNISSTKNIDSIDNEIFVLKNNIYKNQKNMLNVIKLEELMRNKKDILIEYYNSQKYISRDNNIVQKGHVPDPPQIDLLKSKKYSNKKVFKAYEKKSKSGGFTKVVKLL